MVCLIHLPRQIDKLIETDVGIAHPPLRLSEGHTPSVENPGRMGATSKIRDRRPRHQGFAPVCIGAAASN